MKGSIWFATILLLVGLVLSAGCNKQPGPPSPDELKTTDYASLVANLRLLGATVELTSDASPDDIFSATSRTITIDAAEAAVLEFADEATTQAEAELVQGDGSGFDPRPMPDGTTRIIQWNWPATPHWYKSGRIIVQYIGDNQATKDLLRSLLGEQFAGM